MVSITKKPLDAKAATEKYKILNTVKNIIMLIILNLNFFEILCCFSVI